MAGKIRQDARFVPFVVVSQDPSQSSSGSHSVCVSGFFRVLGCGAGFGAVEKKIEAQASSKSTGVALENPSQQSDQSRTWLPRAESI